MKVMILSFAVCYSLTGFKKLFLYLLCQLISIIQKSRTKLENTSMHDGSTLDAKIGDILRLTPAAWCRVNL